MWAQLYLIFLPVYSRLSWLWRVSSTYLCCLVIYLAFLFKNEDLNCVKIRKIFLERAVVAKKRAEYIIKFQAGFGIQNQTEIEIIELPIYFQIPIVKR